MASLPERERIIKSLFSERIRGSDQLVEQYIAHVKIYEDVDYPASPPPRATPPENLKLRYILMSVRSTGRVSLHKSRANDNGTFQIGKSWPLDDLQRLEDTGPRGLVITLQKPYFWSMESNQEKMQFVNALITVYKKYTGGRMFELQNFDERLLAPAHRVSDVRQEDMPRPSSQSQQSQMSGDGRRQAPLAAPLARQPPQQLGSEPRRPPPLNAQDLRSSSVSSAYMPQTPGSNSTASASSGAHTLPRQRTTSEQLPPQNPARQRIVSDGYETRQRREPMMPPIQMMPGQPTNGNRQANGNRSASVVSTATDFQSPPPIEPRSRDRQRLGSPLTAIDTSRRLQQQMQGGPPTPNSTDALPQLTPGHEIRSPLSPPPAKSPARRPSVMSAAGSEAGESVHRQRISSGREQIPRIPSKSGARESPLRTDRPELPWNAITPQAESQPTFNGDGRSPVEPRGAIPPHVAMARTASLQSITSNSSAPDTVPKARPPGEDFETSYLEELLKEFKYTSKRGANALQDQIQEELAAIEFANVVAISEHDQRLEDLMAKLDRGIMQCDDIANTLTIYQFQLNAVSGHVRFIESQNQGLQVQASNQKALIMEIDSVLSNIEISREDVAILQNGRLDSDGDFRKIEKSLANFHRTLKSMQDEKEAGAAMAATRGKGKEYKQESDAFLARFAKFCHIKFQTAVLSSSAPPKDGAPPQIIDGHDDGYMSLFQYSALMLYARDIAPQLQSDIRMEYAGIAKNSWRDAILSFAAQWRPMVRKADDGDAFFSPQAMSGNALRAATLKRSNTFAKQIRSVGKSEKEKPEDESKMPGSQVFSIILDNLTLILTIEQNFVVDLFHLSSLQSIDFPDYVSLNVRTELNLTRLEDHRQIEPNRTLAKQRYELMDGIFGWLQSDLINLGDYFVKLDPVEVIGMLKSLEVVEGEWADSDQEFMLRLYDKVHDRLMQSFTRYIEAQCKSIRDFKLSTTKTRCALLPSFEALPSFVDRIERQLASTDSDEVERSALEVRGAVDEAYEMVTRAMFESVRSIASTAASGASSAVGSAVTASDPEDKEALAYHILMCCNMRHFVQSVGDGAGAKYDSPALIDAQRTAQQHYTDHMQQYVRAVLSRPVGRLADFVAMWEKAAQAAAPGVAPEQLVRQRATLSPASVKRLLSDMDEKDVRRGIAALYKRVVEKHFNDADTGGGGGAGGSVTGASNTQLVNEAWQTCQAGYLAVVDKFLSIVANDVYAKANVRPEWSRNTVVSAFDRRGGA